jgi:hypothetical protein
MNPKTLFPSNTHFHIRWSTACALDWEAFSTRAEAEETARRLAHPHESYRIEERKQACKRCATFWREKVRGLSGTTHVLRAQSQAVKNSSVAARSLPQSVCSF